MRIIYELVRLAVVAAIVGASLYLVLPSGRVIHNLQDPSGGFAQISSVERHGDDLYFGSLVEDAIGRLPAP